MFKIIKKTIKVCLYSLILFSPLLSAFDGLKVLTPVPIISINDIDGNIFHFSKQDKTTIFVFYRGSWCPYCIKQLKSIQNDIFNMLDAKTQLVAISVDRVKIAKKMRRKYNFKFKIISDTKAEILKAFKIVNKLDDKIVKKYKLSYKIDVENDSGMTHHMVAHPAVFIVKNGKITFSEVNTDYKKRTRNEDILKALK